MNAQTVARPSVKLSQTFIGSMPAAISTQVKSKCIANYKLRNLAWPNCSARAMGVMPSYAQYQRSISGDADFGNVRLIDLLEVGIKRRPK